MPIDRDESLRRAENLLRHGQLEAALDEYSRLATAFPADLNLANTLGDLLVRGGLIERASAEFLRIADHFFREGFLSRAAALYKKVLRIAPEQVYALQQLAEIAVAQGKAHDAKTTLQSLVDILRRRGDVASADRAVLRLADFDLTLTDIPLQEHAAQALARSGDAKGAIDRLCQLASRLEEAGRRDGSLRVRQAADAFEAGTADIRVLPERMAVAGSRRDEAGSEQAGEGGGQFDLEARRLRAHVDTHVHGGRLDEARLLAEDLVMRFPESLEHRACLRRVLEAMGDPDPDARLAAHLARAAHEVTLSPMDTADRDPSGLRPRPMGLEALPTPRPSDDPPTRGTGACDEEIDLTPALEGLAVSNASWPQTREALMGAAHVQARHDTGTSAPDGDQPPPPGGLAREVPESAESAVDDQIDRQRLSAALSLVDAGLQSEAVSLLEGAAGRPSTRAEATVALGDLARLRGEASAAERYYQAVLGEPQRSSVRHRASYGLGCALADAARKSEALVVFLELLAETGEYLDTRARVDALSNGSAGV